MVGQNLLPQELGAKWHPGYYSLHSQGSLLLTNPNKESEEVGEVQTKDQKF